MFHFIWWKKVNKQVASQLLIERNWPANNHMNIYTIYSIKLFFLSCCRLFVACEYLAFFLFGDHITVLMNIFQTICSVCKTFSLVNSKQCFNFFVPDGIQWGLKQHFITHDKSCHWSSFQKVHFCTIIIPEGCILVPKVFMLVPKWYILVHFERVPANNSFFFKVYGRKTHVWKNKF